jgi:hypothetical protein
MSELVDFLMYYLSRYFTRLLAEHSLNWFLSRVQMMPKKVKGRNIRAPAVSDFLLGKTTTEALQLNAPIIV